MWEPLYSPKEETFREHPNASKFTKIVTCQLRMKRTPTLQDDPRTLRFAWNDKLYFYTFGMLPTFHEKSSNGKIAWFFPQIYSQ